MDNLRGISLMVLAMAAFAVEDALIKAGTATVPVSQLVLITGMMGTSVLVVASLRKGIRLWSRDLHHPAVIVRLLTDTIGVFFFVTALATVPLTTLAALIQVTPLSLVFCAAMFLGETVGWRRWSAVLAGFLGMLLIIRPGMEGFDATVLLAVGAVVCLTGRDLATHFVPDHMSTLQLSTYGFATMLPAGLMMLPFAPAPIALAGWQWGLMASIATLGLIGYTAVTAAMRIGEVSVVSPFRYSRLILAMALGVVFFGERPDALTLSGAGLILAAGLYTLLREARLRRAA